MATLPSAGSPTLWGTKYNEYLRVEHTATGEHDEITANDLIVKSPWYDVRAYGAVGAADDTTTIQAAIDACATAGGGIVLLPSGTFNVTGLTVNSQDNVNIMGSGIDVTILFLIASSEDHVISIDASDGCSVQNLTINGNSANNTLGHGVRVEDSTDTIIRDIKVLNSPAYGIGAQGTGSGSTFKRLRIESVSVIDSGNDGIDIKNVDDANESIYLNDIYVENPAATKAGIDLRGPCVLSNIHVTGLVAGTSGVRFREGALLSASGFGAHYSSMTSFHIVGDGTQIDSIGVAINADHVSVSGGSVIETGVGFQTNVGEYITVSNVTCYGCQAEGAKASADHTMITGCSFVDCVEGLEVDENQDGVMIKNCTFDSNGTRDLQIDAGATNTQIIGNNIVGGDVNDDGTATIFRENMGYVTETSGTGSINSGVTTDVIAHGLDITPNLITITFTENPSNAVSFWWVDTIGAANFTVNVSADPGASNLDFHWEAKVR